MKIINVLLILLISIYNSECFINYFINKYNGFKGLKETKICNLGKIKYCSKLSRNVYLDNGNITDIKYNTVIKIIEKQDEIFLCFKGSSNIKDWKTNLDKSLVTNIIDYDIYSLHKGYLNRYVSISNKIYKYLDNKTYTNIYICGHSLGGALATICCFDLITKNIIQYNNTYCITFGAPRIGDKNFSKIYNKYKIKTYRIVLSGDLVPKLPLDGNYIHTTSSYYFKNNKVYNKPNKIYIAVKRFFTNICDVDYSLKNHTMDKYIEFLDIL
jgi:hypothetical protein